MWHFDPSGEMSGERPPVFSFTDSSATNCYYGVSVTSGTTTMSRDSFIGNATDGLLVTGGVANADHSIFRGTTSDFASAALTAVGGGLLLAKNCLIIWPRK